MAKPELQRVWLVHKSLTPESGMITWKTEGEKRRVQDILGVSNLQALRKIARNPEPHKGILVPYNPMPESEMMSARVALTNPSKAGMDANTGSNAERGCQK